MVPAGLDAGTAFGAAFVTPALGAAGDFTATVAGGTAVCAVVVDVCVGDVTADGPLAGGGVEAAVSLGGGTVDAPACAGEPFTRGSDCPDAAVAGVSLAGPASGSLSAGRVGFAWLSMPRPPSEDLSIQMSIIARLQPTNCHRIKSHAQVMQLSVQERSFFALRCNC